MAALSDSPASIPRRPKPQAPSLALPAQSCYSIMPTPVMSCRVGSTYQARPLKAPGGAFLTLEATLEQPTGSVCDVAWSPEELGCSLGELLLASASLDRTLRLWDARMPTCTTTLEGHTSSVNRVTWGRNGKLILACADGKIFPWDARMASRFDYKKEHTSSVNSVACSLEGHLASASSDQRICLWALE